MSEHELLRQAIDGQRGADQKLIAEVGLQVVTTLLKKNADYGSSAWQVPVLAPRLSAFDGIQCRMSDKVARLNQLLAGNDAQVAESIADSFRDLVGYGILWLALDARDAAEVAAPAVVVRGSDIDGAHARDRRVYARCSYCQRYSDNPKSLSKTKELPCDCGGTGGWCGSFSPPTRESVWSEAK